MQSGDVERSLRQPVMRGQDGPSGVHASASGHAPGIGEVEVWIMQRDSRAVVAMCFSKQHPVTAETGHTHVVQCGPCTGQCQVRRRRR